MNIFKIFEQFIGFKPPPHKLPFNLDEQNDEPKYDVRTDTPKEPAPKVFDDLNDNLYYIRKRFDIPRNNDVIIRDIMLKGDVRAFMVFYDGMCDGTSINDGIIKALLELPVFNHIEKKYSADMIYEKLLIHNQVSVKSDYDSLVDDINFGSCGLFVDGINEAFSIDVKDWPHRSIEKPENEQSIYGPQESFAEMLRGNSALIRKILKTEKLVCEKTVVGNISKTRGVIMYISDIANTELVDEVRRRLDGLSMDYVMAIEEISLMLSENPLMITGHILATERPDRTARALSEGRVALLLSGSTRALIFPTNIYEMTHAASDAYLRVDFANLSRIVRMVAMGISILLPGVFLAITMFHEEMLPTYLLYAISASRQNVPFPSIVELLLMDFSFEMIREAGIRMPGPIGSILGIVGGLILGQAAVSAKVVSPIMIIVIALTGIGSFATADYSLGWSFRILKLIFVLLGGCLGFFGIGLGMFMYAVLLASSKSFGVPFLSPLPGQKGLKNDIFVPPIWKMEKRPRFLRPKKERKEDKISKKWRAGR